MRAVGRFAVASLLAFGVLAAAGLWILDRSTRHEAVRDAARLTRLNGEGIVEPALTDALVAGDRGALSRIDRLVRRRVLRDPVARVKIWTVDGRVVYSDEPREIGARYGLGSEERAALATGDPEAEIADLHKPENRLDRTGVKLMEVYVPVHTRTGRQLLFESYLRYASVTGNGRALLVSLAPIVLGALLVLALVQMPLAWSLARRVRDGQLEREVLLRRSLDASETERRRIAQHLHDGPVQSLAGVSFTLAAAARRVNGSDHGAAQSLSAAAAGTRQSIRELRTLLVDIYPPDLHRTGLAAALSDLLAPLQSHGVAARLDVPDDLELEPTTEALLFRTAQEALRNVVAHARAGEVAVAVAADPEHAAITVTDDGAGFDAGSREWRPEGHFGLRMLEDLARDAGGRLEVRSAPGRGTSVSAEVPRR